MGDYTCIWYVINPEAKLTEYIEVNIQFIFIAVKLVSTSVIPLWKCFMYSKELKSKVEPL